MQALLKWCSPILLVSKCFQSYWPETAVKSCNLKVTGKQCKNIFGKESSDRSARANSIHIVFKYLVTCCLADVSLDDLSVSAVDGERSKTTKVHCTSEGGIGNWNSGTWSGTMLHKVSIGCFSEKNHSNFQSRLNSQLGVGKTVFDQHSVDYEIRKVIIRLFLWLGIFQSRRQFEFT